MSSLASCLVGICATLLAGTHGVQAVTVSQALSRPKLSSAVVSAAAEALTNKKESHKSDAAPIKKVNLDVYYETRCPGCLMFINQTLEPLWRHQDFADYLNVTMYTYGNGMTIPVADISEGYKFWHPETTGKGWNDVQICQHGSDECLGNLVILCAKDIADKDKYMELIFCMAATTIEGYGEEKSTYECMQKNGIDHNKVRDCATSPHGNQLATEAGKQTSLLKNRLGTPWVMVGGAHADDSSLMNTTLLMKSVCSHVDNAPTSCAPFKNQPAAPAHAQPEDSGDDFQVLKDMKDTDLIKVNRGHV